MTNWIEFFYCFFFGASMLLCVTGLWFNRILPGIDRWGKHFFRTFFLILLSATFFGLLELFFYYYPVQLELLYFVVLMESLFLSLSLIMLPVYLLHSCGENVRSSHLFRIAFFLEAVFVVLSAAAPFIGNFSSMTEDMQFVRGPLYPLLVLPLTFMMLVILAGVIRRRKQLSSKTFLSFLIAIVPMTASLLVQLFIDVFPLLDICIVLSAMAMFGFRVSDQIEQDLRQQREIARQQQEIANQHASILVLQMRPHFIYNTMTSIYSLCNQDPEKTRQVVLDFTTYLRKNFTAIASAEPIPFTSELEHTRAYLAVEQAQYEDSLFVEYDTPHTMFRVPPLTLQPIVENAVKHGRDPYAGPFHISIRTRKTDSASEITVADDGRGYDPADDGEMHVALKNIQQRLDIMCGGQMTIAPGKDRGTVVTVTIPDGGYRSL